MIAEPVGRANVRDRSTAASLSLVAPVDGVLVPLEDLPDAVFAQRMMGDGISIDPTGHILVAPCAGKVVQLHRARHALTIVTDDGISILLHIGLDTVSLGGKGFVALVKEGDRVERRQPLIDFDLDVIAQGALSALTEMIVTDGAADLSFRRTEGLVRAGADEVARIGPARPANGTAAEAAGPALRSAPVSILNPSGLHARPAARLAHRAKHFSARVVVHKGELSASASSVSELMSLDLARGDQVWLSAQGPDAQAALTELKGLIEQGLGEDTSHAPAPEISERRFAPANANVIGGVAASPGLAIGTVALGIEALPDFERASADSARELELMEHSLAEVRKQLELEQAKFRSNGELEKAQIFAAHAELIDDEGFRLEATRAIRAGASAAAAWQDAVQEQAAKLRGLKSPLLRQRADDLNDVGRRVLYRILGISPKARAYTKSTLLVCDELTPSAVAHLDADRIGALITAQGGSSSHAAIIARSMGVPYVAGIGQAIERLIEGQQLIVDGSEGSLTLEPTRDALEQAEREIARRRQVRAAELAQARGLAHTLDGRAVEVGANIGNVKEAEQAIEQGADGVGLLRSEFLFMNRRVAPDEAEQRAQLQAIARALGPQRSLVVRTLDVGGDKPLSYMPLAAEDNPFLGVRGLRLSLRFPDIFATQLRAVLATATLTKLHVMFPMLARLDELTAAKAYVQKAAQELGLDPALIKIGVMVEVPSAALMADVLAKEVDFFSIGTNDLTQYTLAMDRGHPELAAEADQLEPAVLRLIQTTTRAAHAEKKWVGVCGGLAAEALAVPLLVGLDVDELSVPAPAVPEIKARVRRLNHARCRELATQALQAPNAQAVRALLKDFT